MVTASGEMLHAVQAVNDTVQIISATLIPLVYIYVFIVHRNAILAHLRTIAIRSSAATGRIVRAADTGVHGPTLLLRGIGGRTSLYATGPRPILMELRIGRFIILRERKLPAAAVAALEAAVSATRKRKLQAATMTAVEGAVATTEAAVTNRGPGRHRAEP